MGGFVRPNLRHAWINLDGAMIAVALLAGVMVAGTMIRTPPGGDGSAFGSHVGGLRTLGPTETLVTFEDGTSRAVEGWSTGARNEAHVGLGAVWLVQPGDAPLGRRFPLPEGTTAATLRLEIIALDDWALEGLELTVNGRALLRQRFSSRPDLIAAQQTEVIEAEGVTLRAQLDPPRELGFAGGAAAQAETRLVVEVALEAPGPELALGLTPLPALPARTDGAAAPAYAVDNLMVVAARPR
jgi:hypothetical protein